MAGVTDWVRKALAKLGSDAPDTEVQAFIRENAPTVPASHVSLALRKLRGKVVPARKKPSRSRPKNAEPGAPPDRGGM